MFWLAKRNVPRRDATRGLSQASVTTGNMRIMKLSGRALIYLGTFCILGGAPAPYLFILRLSGCFQSVTTICAASMTL